jgi:hypothetical protein
MQDARMLELIDQEIKDNHISMEHLELKLKELQERQQLLYAQRTIIINSKWGNSNDSSTF